ncbi:hypothetical protein LTR80_012145 [Exophiala xenobiotica]
MTFDHLPKLQSLSSLLPGEQASSHRYAGVGGGGGSDVISASLLGHLLQRHGKQMDVLISTRTWATGSQGVKREVYNHDGPAMGVGGRPVSGTFRVASNTYTEGRDLEALLVRHHEMIYLVLDQAESKSDIPEADRVTLEEQFGVILAQPGPLVQTVLTVDTGGDVFGADWTGSSTPEQDLRVQKAMTFLKASYNLVTAVVAPGIDAPEDAPVKAANADGVVYRPTPEERMMLLDLLINDYRMDGSDPRYFGKTNLALQAGLKGVLGWTSVDLPDFVVDTWDNPWSSFVYIRECMSDVVLMSTVQLHSRIG